MSISRIASRYAKSLLDLAIEGNSLEATLGDVKGFNKMLENRDLQLLLKSPIVSASDKAAIFKSLFSGKVSDLTMSFFNIILKKGREQYLPEIAAEFIAQYKAIKGITDVILTTAAPLSDDLLAEIKKELVDSSSTKGTVEIETKLDKNLIGGFVIEIGDLLYDNSIAHKLNEMKKQFASTK
jgi:F-type H+-transporting ATPase subunit delta